MHLGTSFVLEAGNTMPHGMFHRGLGIKEPLDSHLPDSHDHLFCPMLYHFKI